MIDILTKENSNTLAFQCDKPRSYFKHKMFFFKKTINYSFQDPVKVKPCVYDLYISEISVNDQKTLNELFLRIVEGMTLEDATFIKFKEEKVQECKAMITVDIIGYKKLDNIVKPIWKVKSAHKID